MEEKQIPWVSPAVIEAKRAQLATARDVAGGLVIANQDDADRASQLRHGLKEERKAIEGLRKPIADQIRAALNTFNAMFKPSVELIDEALSDIDRAISEWALAAKERQRKAFAEAAQLTIAGEHTAARELLAVSNEAAAKVAPRGTSVREVWHAEINNPAAVPRDWCVPDEKRIQAMARATPDNQQPTPIDGVHYVRKVIVTDTHRKKRK